MKTAVLLPTTYLGPVSYYRRLAAYDHVELELWEHYVKQTLRNRCLIQTEAGIQALTVPVERHMPPGTPIKDIRLSDHGRWRHLHWQALTTAYERSPYFEYLADDLHAVYEQQYTYLIDFNEALRHVVCDLIGLHPDIQPTSSYIARPEADDCRDLYDPHARTRDSYIYSRPYFQIFADRHGFMPDLSIVDLLFNQGPESILYLLCDLPDRADAPASTNHSH